nr:ABC-type transport auxiliary lipoprotein family protein [uncultured Desulfuromonas sp.]
MKSVRYPVFFLITFVLLSACSTTNTPKTRYYLIASKEQPVAPLSVPPVIHTECAPFLSQGGLVIEYPDQTIQTAHYHRWAEPLPAMIARYLQRRLQMSFEADFEPPVITLLIDRFHRLNTGEVVFSGQWWANNDPPQSFSYKMRPTDNSYETTVSDLQRLLDQQNDTMVQTLSPHTLAHTETP